MPSYPSFTLDLNAQKLIQTEGENLFGWVTELDKVFHHRTSHHSLVRAIRSTRPTAGGQGSQRAGRKAIVEGLKALDKQ
jgi:hypothetical protein